jgi:predicted MFS family arabinose efflux permease
MIGPAVSGLVIAAFGSGWAFLINGASFIAVLISLAFIRVAELRPNARATGARGRFVEGVRYAWGRRDLKAILAMLFLIGTFGLNFPIFISTMAVGVFHVDARGYGVLSSITAIGPVAGALIGAGRRPQFNVLAISAAVIGVSFAIAAVAPGYWSFAASLAVVGLAVLIFTNATNSLIQLSTEPALRGRMMALRVGIALGGTPIGAPIVGWVANHFGPRCALGVGAGAGFLAGVVAVLTLKAPTDRGASRPKAKVAL